MAVASLEITEFSRAPGEPGRSWPRPRRAGRLPGSVCRRRSRWPDGGLVVRQILPALARSPSSVACATQRQPVGQVDAAGVGQVFLLEQPLGQGQRLLPDERVVQQVEGLRWRPWSCRGCRSPCPARRNRRPPASAASGRAAAAGRRCGACSSAPPLRSAGPRGRYSRSSMTLQVPGGRAVGPGQVESAGGGQHGVADLLGVEPARAVPPDEPVGRIDGKLVGRRLRTELVGPAQHHARTSFLTDQPSRTNCAAR